MTRPLPRNQIEAIEDLEGVERVYCLSAEVMSPFPIRGVRLEDIQAELEFADPRTEIGGAFARGDSLILSQFLADSFGFSVGDEVRLSNVPRYAADFKPARFFMRDKKTVALFHFDTDTEELFLDDSGNDHHGRPEGSPTLAKVTR